MYKNDILQIKNIFKNKFNYSPTIKECCYILKNELQAPPKCKNEFCVNLAKFTRTYNYCCKICSDTDRFRNSKIQEKRRYKIDYAVVHKKVVETKNTVSIDGLTIHQRSNIKTMITRNNNYDTWYKNTIFGIKNKTIESKELSSQKRSKTIFDEYGVTHFGGGYSKIKKLNINGKIFFFQGYEDVVLYELIIKKNYNVFDIESCIRYNYHKFKYNINGFNSDR